MNTDEKIQLQHPAGQKAIRMDLQKYQPLKEAILFHLSSVKEATHKEIHESVLNRFEQNAIAFDGSVEWHMEWVKLDLEAKKEIKRISTKSPIKWAINS